MIVPFKGTLKVKQKGQSPLAKVMWQQFTVVCSTSGCFLVAVTIIAKLTKRAAFPNPQAKVEDRPSISFMTSITIEVAAKASCRPG